MAENYRDQQLLELAKKSPKPGPGGALGNDASGRPDFDKGELPSNTRRPNFKKGGKITKRFANGGSVTDATPAPDFKQEQKKFADEYMTRENKAAMDTAKAANDSGMGSAMGKFKKGGKVTRRYDGGGRVSDSVDTGSVNARADEKSIAQGEKDFGRNNSNIRNKVGTRSGEPTVGPLIQVYPTPKGEKMYERERNVPPEAMYERNLQKYPEAMPGRSRGEQYPEAMPGRPRAEPMPEAMPGIVNKPGQVVRPPQRGIEGSINDVKRYEAEQERIAKEPKGKRGDPLTHAVNRAEPDPGAPDPSGFQIEKSLGRGQTGTLLSESRRWREDSAANRSTYKDNRELHGYNKGGLVKHGSSTRVSCRNK